MIVVFAACHDPATRCSHWVAQRNCERLAAELGQATTLLDGEHARRDSLESALAGDVSGLAFFGHGSEDRLLNADGAAVLDGDNVKLLADRWVHAFACRAGNDLPGDAAAAGVRCFVGYDSAVLVEWEPEDIPSPIRDAFVQLVTQTTLELARGIHDITTLRRAAVEAQGAVIEWCNDHPGEAPGLEITAHQLLARLVVRCCEP